MPTPVDRMAVLMINWAPRHPSGATSRYPWQVLNRSELHAGRQGALDQDTLDRRRRVLGPDHPDTVDSAHNLAIDLRA
jgi:hypothetical protein